MSVTQLIGVMANCRNFNKQLVLVNRASNKTMIVKSMTYHKGVVYFEIDKGNDLSMTLSSKEMALLLDNYVIYEVSRSFTA